MIEAFSVVGIKLAKQGIATSSCLKCLSPFESSSFVVVLPSFRSLLDKISGFLNLRFPSQRFGKPF